MKIKICGLTDPRETIFLNEAGADYAGFVFYEKSCFPLFSRYY